MLWRRNFISPTNWELPQHPGAVQKELKIPAKASFALSLENPDKPAPPDAGLIKERAGSGTSKRLKEEFRGRRFAAENERLLDYEGAEFVLIGARPDPARELAIEFEEDLRHRPTRRIFSIGCIGRNRARPSNHCCKANGAKGLAQAAGWSGPSAGVLLRVRRKS